MFTWGKHLIKVINNFATKEELDILTNYLNRLPQPKTNSAYWLEFIEGNHDPDNSIEDVKVKEVMESLNTRMHTYITQTYFPEAGLSITKDKGHRALELIKWKEGSRLLPHSDWRLEDGSPQPLVLPQFTVGSLIYINKDYAGGEINFPDYEFKLDPQPGDLILFPCQYMHEVLEVSALEGKTQARRYTMPVFYWFNLEAIEDNHG